MTGATGSTFLGFDFGSQSIGIAVASRPSGMATPLSAVHMSRSGPDWAGIDALVADWQPAAFVVGLALNATGEQTPMGRRAAKFGRRLQGRYGRPVHWVDETLSTEAARHALRAARPRRRPRKADIDNTAAALILERFFGASQ